MPLPQPPVPLEDVCSVVFNNVLYTYSADAFLSLPLTPGAQWKRLPSGVTVTGGACVGTTPKDSSQAAFFVVGGKGPNSDYKGLQKFTYSTGKWETIPLEPHVTQERLWHGVAYLNSTDNILMYAGAQDGAKTQSTQTFTIGASAPYTVKAWESSAPPTINPILLPWSESQAVLVGGSEFNNKVMLFSYEAGWVDSGASLAAPLSKNITAMKAAIVTADDGCKSLYTFDVTTSPNEVNRTVLINGQGQPVPESVAITTQSKDQAPAKKRSWSERRQAKSLTETGWPQYNASLAPTAIRSNFAVAEDPNGLVVIAGGNKDDVLCIFDGRNNGWINASEKLTPQKAVSDDANSNATTSTAPTGVATPSFKPIAANTESPSPLNANAILGITLGAIVGLAMFLIIVYICIRRRRRQQDFYEAGHNRRASGVASPEKGGFAYASDSLPQGPALGTFRGHQPQDSQNSFSSMAILMGRVNQQKPPGVQRNNSKETKRSSMDSNFKTALKSTISKPIPQAGEQNLTGPPSRPETRDDRGVSFGPNVAEPRPRGPKPERQGSTRRSSGWNRYWSGGSALNILGFGNRQESKRATVDSDQSSHYSADAHRITQDSATVPPLHVTHMVPEPKPKFQRVNSGSPTMANYDPRIKDEMRAQIERPVSQVSAQSGYSSGIPASVHDAWDPTSSNRPWGADRAPTGSYNGNFTTGLTPPASSSGASGPQSGLSRQPQLSTAATSSDMSWLNLGDFRRL